MSNRLSYISVALLFLFSACCGVKKKEDVVIPNSGVIAALCIGIERVDSEAYGGWDGFAAGAELDAVLMSSRLAEHRVPVSLLLNEDATAAGIALALHETIRSLSAGDLLIVSISAHGGQMPGTKDEDDGLDEYICAYDRPILDNTINEWLRMAPAGLRILWICDTCHAATMHRIIPAPYVFSARAIPDKFRAELILLAGSSESGYSYGGFLGGQWTQSILSVGFVGMTPRMLFDRASRLVQGQVPHYVEYGDVSSGFRDGVFIFQ